MATIPVVSDKREEKPVGTVNESTKKEMNKGAWIAEEDVKLAEAITVYGAKKWKIIAAKAGLNRSGKSCRLRWLNYLRPNIKRGNISDQEEDLILRLHKLLGNRWSLIAGRLPGRTDNEIKNYWNSHLSKKIKQREKKVRTEDEKKQVAEKESFETSEENTGVGGEKSKIKLDFDDFFDFSNEGPLNLQWMSQFLELDERSVEFNGL